MNKTIREYVRENKRKINYLYHGETNKKIRVINQPFEKTNKMVNFAF